MTKDELIKLQDEVIAQEQKLRFEHFTNRDALDLGNLMAKKAYDSGTDIAICIRKLNGAILFQHLTDGTTLDNQGWMQRKFNTVSRCEFSSYLAWIKSQISGETVASRGLDEREYVFCGGGFPIKLKTGEFVAVAIVSNLPHEKDHAFVVEAIEDFLKGK